MAGVDYHASCGSYVRLSAKDYQHPAAAIWKFEDMEHPATLRYPGVKVETCELAAGHDGLCEVFVDSPMNGDRLTYWLRWQKAEDLAESHEWISGTGCPEVSANGWRCTRRTGHDEGHVFLSC